MSAPTNPDTKEKKPHDVERFVEYKVINDGKAFQLRDGTIFEYDEYGGWTDEYGNIYDKSGQPYLPEEDYDEDEEDINDDEGEEEDEEDYDEEDEDDDDGDYEDDDEDDDYNDEYYGEDNEWASIHDIISWKKVTEEAINNLRKKKNEIKEELIKFVGVFVAKTKRKASERFCVEIVNERKITQKEFEDFLKEKINISDITDFEEVPIKTRLGAQFDEKANYNNVYRINSKSMETLLRILDLFGEEFGGYPFIAYPYKLGETLEADVKNVVKNKEITKKQSENTAEKKQEPKADVKKDNGFDAVISKE